MTVRVKRTTQPDQVRTLIELRREAFFGAEASTSETSLVMDIFDALSTTEHLVAIDRGEILGGARMTEDSPAGLPHDDSFDFRSRLPDGARIAACTMLALRPREEPDDRSLHALVNTSALWAWTRGLTYVCTAIDPASATRLQSDGLDPVGEPYTEPNGRTVMPLVLNLSTMGPEFTELVRRSDLKLWLAGMERALFDEGEIITQRGEPGDEAYLLLGGSADVLAYGAEPGGPIVRSFGPGEVFGELSLLTDRPRSATVVASEPTEMLVLSRAQFDEQLQENPVLTRALLRSIGDRFHETIVVLNETEDLNRNPVDEDPPAPSDSEQGA